MTEITVRHECGDSSDGGGYTAALIGRALSEGSMTMTKAEEIRRGLDKEFAESAAQYTRRESSTIASRIAERLYSSLLYCLDVYLLSLKDDSAAVSLLTTIPVGELLDRGRGAVLRVHDENIRIFGKAYRKRLPVQLAEYRYVMDKAFDEYFASYSARFDAENPIASVDYPLLGRQAYSLTSQGAAFINEYYTAIWLENELCSCIAWNELEALLAGYGRTYHAHYSALLFNIAEVLLKNLLAGALLGKPAFFTRLTEDDAAVLTERFTTFGSEELCDAVSEKFGAYENAFEEPRVYPYACGYIPVFSSELAAAIKNGTLRTFLVLAPQPSAQSIYPN